jgi:DNA-3-methyladenine glycosylase
VIATPALPRAFYERPTAQVARDLVGTLLACETRGVLRVGRIVETEAYLGPHDRASHSSRGRTPRNASMFGEAGRAYVYLVYGMHHCFNVVTEGGAGAAVLVRALEPVEGCRGRTGGPGLLCRALGIDRRLDGADLAGPRLRILPRAPGDAPRLVAGPRVGVDYAGAWARRRLRFHEAGSPWVSLSAGAAARR